jgi:hypothetical protein
VKRRVDEFDFPNFGKMQDYAERVCFHPDTRLSLLIKRTTECANIRVNFHRSQPLSLYAFLDELFADFH